MLLDHASFSCSIAGGSPKKTSWSLLSTIKCDGFPDRGDGDRLSSRARPAKKAPLLIATLTGLLWRAPAGRLLAAGAHPISSPTNLRRSWSRRQPREALE